MTRPHLKYREEDFLPNVVGATRELFTSKPWRLDIGQLDLYQRWADVVCDSYEIPEVGVQKVDLDQVGFAYTVGSLGAPNIIIGRYSLATLFVAMGAHIKASLGVEPFDSSIDHIAWGYSLFYVVRPVMFRSRVREGRIEGLTARDTFSRDTWNRLVELRLTAGDNLLDPAFDIRTLDAEDDLVNPDEVEEANEDQELAPVLHIQPVRPAIIRENLRDALESLPITILRKLSRVLISGGYRISKPVLIDRLMEHPVAVVNAAERMGIQL